MGRQESLQACALKSDKNPGGDLFILTPSITCISIRRASLWQAQGATYASRTCASDEFRNAYSVVYV